MTLIRIPRLGNLHCMMAKSVEDSTIYESPDGGKTIYSRKSGSSGRATHPQVMRREDTTLRDQMKEDQLWYKIRREAKTNATLADILEQAKMVYALIKKENN